MKKNRLMGLLLLLLSMPAAVWAQWSYGLRLGVNFSTMKWKPIDPKFKVGTQLGAFATYNFTNTWSMQAELLYELNGCRMELVHSEEGLHSEKEEIYKRNQHYLSLPILARYQFHTGVHLELGPQFSYMLQSKGIFKGDHFALSGYKPWDVGLVIGAGYAFNDHLDFGFRYVHGFLSTTDYVADDFKAKNRNIQVNLGYRF